MKRTANRDAGRWVGELVEFKGNNTFSEWIDNKYIVYSYGYHWIMYIFDNHQGVWIGCSEKRSSTTSKQTTQLHPNQPINYWLTQKELQNVKRST